MTCAMVHLGDLDEAQFHGELALELARRSGYRLVEIRALITLAEARVGLGDGRLAAELCGKALELGLDTGYVVGQAMATRLRADTSGTLATPPERLRQCCGRPDLS